MDFLLNKHVGVLEELSAMMTTGRGAIANLLILAVGQSTRSWRPDAHLEQSQDGGTIVCNCNVLEIKRFKKL